MQKKFYITTTLPYVNDNPHIGHVMEFVRADALARYHALLGEEVFFNTGTDEHGAKIYQKAAEQGKGTQEYVDEYAEKFRVLKGTLNLFPEVHFIRTTDAHHIAAAQEFWRRCDKAGDIYKKNYRVKYCVGCELEKTESELEEGKCPIHPNREIEIIDEENYFFRFSKYQKALLDFYDEHPDFVVPDFRQNEIRAFAERGLEDFSISRLKAKMPWGVPVPGDESQVMYVWFDALVNYISTLGWPEDEKNFTDFWGTKENPNAIQIAGKDNLRQQSAIWQAMLFSAGLPNTKRIIINGFITSGGVKMSKSLGNVIAPEEILASFRGAALFPEDVLRFAVLHDIPAFEDGDMTHESIRISYRANLQNGLGNLVSRVMKMAVTHLAAPVDISEISAGIFPEEYQKAFEALDTKKAFDIALKSAQELDAEIQRTEPFKVVKVDPEKGREIISTLVLRLCEISRLLAPFLPATAEEIGRLIREHQVPDSALFASVEK